ncbi:phospholipid-transporting ATPase IF-like [Macrosteles quadrilineatus]|uniref:phospholipid-transporting ATPase IF-like n=1 Tax=Macrosteles quadrilineatus TaxID=74068 RepID=UPI0023E0E7A8|nr:phospholipid-transporting ATPase IF-like [Macrosteles quadrilineatus]
MGNHGSTTLQARTILIGKQDDTVYPDNRVISYKYTPWNYLPKNLWEQFRRVANFYFLCMGIISAVIPDSPVSSWATLGPLMFVVMVSAIKQGYEDILRHKADNKINNSLVTVVRDGVAQEITCKKICVGDIVRVGLDGEIPCDMVMLISSHPDSKAYITTANLDGENNLKTVECPLDTDLTVDHLPYLSGHISCESPTVDLYRFHGNISLSLSQGEGDIETLNPAFVKDGYMMESLHGDSCRGRHRCSFSKLHFLAQQEYSAPLTSDNLLLRGARLRNTEYIFGCAVYTGQETKLALNSTLTINKFSIVEKSINLFLFFFFALLLVEVFVSVILTFYSRTYTNKNENLWYMGIEDSFSISEFVEDILIYIVLYYYIIPISLYITIELERFFGSFFFGWDQEMLCDGQAAICNTSDLNEELGQVQYLFSDKTGTLTENDMHFRRCSVDGSLYCEREGRLMVLPPSGSTLSATPLPHWPPEVEQFLLAMALCHTVQTLEQTTVDCPQYQASSPDEKALVEAAARCGVVYLGTSAGLMSVSVRGRVRNYKKLQTLEFTSDRKRMSVVVSDSVDQVWLYSKGAETSMMPLMKTGPIKETIRHYTDFSLRGLRTLVFGMRRLDGAEYQSLARILRNARSVIDTEQRERLLTEAFAGLEQCLHLQGATAVEDRLQDNVPETLELLKTAGIKVWVLTGDKVETALNVAYSCGHFKLGTQELDLINISNEIDCVSALRDVADRMAREPLAQYGLVLDGPTVMVALTHAPMLLQQVALDCTSVLGCRLSPRQKAEMVRMVKRSQGRPVVAAVGDGANDVSMIQEANVGFGIIGKEGRQAVRCSDFAFAKFHCLSRAMLVHGQWYYLRAATMVQYFFYKNIVFITPQLYFSLLNGLSPQPLYLSVFLVLYNTIFTAAPINIYALLEQNYPSSMLLSAPHLYKRQRGNRLMSWPQFAQWMVVGVWHSVVVYFVPALLVTTNPVILADNTTMDLVAFGTTVLHNIVLVVNLKLWIHSTFWTSLFLISVVSSIATFMVFCCVYNSFVMVTNSLQSLYYVYFRLLSSYNFWFISLLTVTSSLIPDVLIKVFQNQKFGRPQIPSWLPSRRRGVFVLPTLESKS